MAIINAKQGRIYNVGTKIMSDETIMLDLNEGNGSFACGNIPIRELIEHLNTIEGVEASYTPSAPRREVPQGIGAVIQSNYSPNIKLVRVLTGPGKNWVQNVRGDKSDSAWYTDSEVDKYINNANAYTVTSEGVTP